MNVHSTLALTLDSVVQCSEFVKMVLFRFARAIQSFPSNKNLATERESGNLLSVWEEIFEALDLELIVRPKENNN